MSQGHDNHDDEVLGRIESGPRDSSLQPNSSSNEETLELPEGAIVALRKSGGLRFSTRTLIVYGNGEALYTASRGSGLKTQSTALELTEAQQLRLRRALARINFSSLPKGPGRASPDAYVYEITVHTLGQTHSIEAWDGSIPAALKPVLEQLRRIMPSS